METYPAQIGYRFNERGDRCVGTLINRAAIDTQTGKQASPDATFTIEAQDNGTYAVTMRGGHRSGTRYATYTNLRDAQIAGIRWASRRFRVPA